MDKIIFLFAIIICSFYAYIKILNARVKSYWPISLAAVSAALSFAAHLMSDSMPDWRYFLIFFVVALIMLFVARQRLDVTLTAILLSIGISYGFGLLALFAAFTTLHGIPDINNIAIAISGAALQFCMMYILFKFPRLKNGLVFLRTKPWAGSVGLVMSGIILACVAVIRSKNVDLNTTIGFLFIAIFCIAMLIIWGMINLTNLYRIRMFEQEKHEDEETIARLSASNEALARINHSDNKVLPAMQLAVNRFLKEAEAELSPRTRQKGEALSEELGEIMRHRSGNQYAGKFMALPKTGIYTIDAILGYMTLKAEEKNIRLDLEIGGGRLIKDGANGFLGALETLLADLIENAIIATAKAERRHVLVSLGLEDETLVVAVSDSGVPFEPETLSKLGVEKTSTHFDEGGSGIGYMTIFEILETLNASLSIKPAEGFTKTVEVRFDGERQLAIHN